MRTIDLTNDQFQRLDDRVATTFIKPLLERDVDLQSVRWIQSARNGNYALLTSKLGQQYKFNNPFGEDGSQFFLKCGAVRQRVRVKTTFLAQASDITESTLLQCGFVSQRQFIEFWDSNYSFKWSDNPFVWVVTVQIRYTQGVNGDR